MCTNTLVGRNPGFLFLSVESSSIWMGMTAQIDKKHYGDVIMSGIHRSPMNSPHKGPVVWKCFHLLTSSWIVYKGICCNCWMNAYFYAYPVVKSLTHWGPVTLFGDIDFGQHWLRWWLVAWWIQSITRANTDLSSVRSSDIHLRAISPEIPQT